MRLSLLPARWAPWVALLAAPVLIHAPLWLLGLSTDPIYFTSGLAELGPHGGLPGLPGWLDPNAGFTTAALGGFAAQQWLHGIVPWWNPYTWVGMSLAAEAQPAPLFLPFTLLLALPDGVLWNKIALQVVGGFAMFGLLRECGMARRLALLGGVLFELNGTFAWWAHAPINPLAFLPLILLGIERAARFARERRPGGWAWVAVGIAASLYGGFPEVAFIDALLAACLAGWRIMLAGNWHACLAVARKLAVAGAIGLLLSAPATMPFLLALPDSAIGGHAGIGDLPTERSVWALLLVPYVQGPLGQTAPWYLAGGYLGLPVVWLAMLALTRSDGRRGLRWVLAAWVLLAIGKSLQWPGIGPAFDMIPFVRQAAFYLYAIPSYQTACLLLACLGLQDWVEHGPPALIARVGATALVLALLVRTVWMARVWFVPVLHISHLHAACIVAGVGAGVGALLAVVALVWRAPGRARRSCSRCRCCRAHASCRSTWTSWPSCADIWDGSASIRLARLRRTGAPGSASPRSITTCCRCRCAGSATSNGIWTPVPAQSRSRVTFRPPRPARRAARTRCCGGWTRSRRSACAMCWRRWAATRSTARRPSRACFAAASPISSNCRTRHRMSRHAAEPAG
jgi:hypothetical protein